MADQPVDNQQFESFPELHETPEEIAFELRAHEGALWTGGRLLIGIWAFAFAALAFAYFYLRSANNENLWRPGGVTAPTAIGAAIFAVTVAERADRQVRRAALPAKETSGLAGRGVDGRLRGPPGRRAADLAADPAPVLPGSSGYASCFIAWGAMNIALSCSAGPTGSRPSSPGSSGCAGPWEDGGAPTSTLPVARLFRVNLNGCTYFWGFIALIATFFWVLFYVI